MQVNKKKLKKLKDWLTTMSNVPEAALKAGQYALDDTDMIWYPKKNPKYPVMKREDNMNLYNEDEHTLLKRFKREFRKRMKDAE